MSHDILAVDVGTSALKIGVFSPSLEKRCEARRTYRPQMYDRGKVDIDPELWWQALSDAARRWHPSSPAWGSSRSL